MKAMSTNNENPQKASRPFDLNRDGFIMGEGGAILVIESLEHALARGAHIYCELAGYAATCDAYHITSPDPEGKGLAQSMIKAMRDANVEPHQVDYINAHGTSTPYNDKFETIAIKKIFGDHSRKVNISSHQVDDRPPPPARPAASRRSSASRPSRPASCPRPSITSPRIRSATSTTRRT